MALVRKVSGPSTARVGRRVSYEVDRFDRESVAEEESGLVNWIVKSDEGATLAEFKKAGPVLEIEVPEAWSGLTVVAMPYMRTPTRSISVLTRVSATVVAPGGDGRDVAISNEGQRWFASVDDEPRFYVGTDVRYGRRRGLQNTTPTQVYLPEGWEGRHGEWAWLLYPTIRCESQGSFTCLNTYDRARFTFGHIQYAVHTANDNFVLFLRDLLKLPLAESYFPDLVLSGGRVHRRGLRGGLSQLESSQGTDALQDYFNPVEESVDDQEVDVAARMVDWCRRDPAFRELQVDFAVHHQKKRLQECGRKLRLDGVSDKVCLVILDIRHQGRAMYSTMQRALETSDPFDALTEIGASTYPRRLATLKAGLRDLEQRGRIGSKVYDPDAGDFVVPGGA